MQEKGLTGYPKAGFWFGLHQEGKALDPRHEIMLETLKLPMGPDVHMHRATIDHYLVQRLPFYGVGYSDHTPLEAFHYDETIRQAALIFKRKGEMQTVSARLVVDASGHAGALARQFGLTADPDELHTHTRSLFGHFRDVNYLEDRYPYNPAFRLSRDGVTIHHCFRGGWLWVIRFDNGETSIGLMLDPRIYPMNKDHSPEEELQQFIDRYPDVQAQLRDMQPTRPLVRTGRVQFHTTSMLGPGFILTPHAAGFIEPIFSTGLALTAAFVARFVPYVKAALRENDFDTQRFRPLEETFYRELHHIDLLVSGTLASFRDYDVMKQFLRFWASSNMLHFLIMIFGRMQDPKGANLLLGAGAESWRDRLRQMHTLVMDPSLDDATAAAQLKALNDELPDAFNIINTELRSGKACLFTLTRPNGDFIRFCYELFNHIPEVKADRDIGRFYEFITRAQMAEVNMRTQYALGKWTGSPYARRIDNIHALTNSKDYPGNKDFFAPFSDFWNGRFLEKV